MLGMHGEGLTWFYCKIPFYRLLFSVSAVDKEWGLPSAARATLTQRMKNMHTQHINFHLVSISLILLKIA